MLALAMNDQIDNVWQIRVKTSMGLKFIPRCLSGRPPRVNSGYSKRSPHATTLAEVSGKVDVSSPRLRRKLIPEVQGNIGLPLCQNTARACMIRARCIITE